MRALVFGGPWKMDIEDRQVKIPNKGEVQIRIEATGICGSDIHGYTGHTGRRHEGQVMGHETVGRISAIGNGVTGLREDDLVTINPVMACGVCENCIHGAEQSCASLRVLGVVPEHDAAFAEYVTVPSINVIPLPSLQKSWLGALVEPLAVGYHAARRADIARDEDVVVLGGGPIGQACAIAARRLGAGHIVVSEIVQSRIHLLTQLGFTCVHPNALSATFEASMSKPSVVIDAVGSSESLTTALNISSTRARVTLVGMADPSISIPAYRLSVDERTVVGSFCYSNSDFRDTADWVASHEDQVSPLVDRAVPLSDGPEIFRQLGDHSIDAHKILLLPSLSQ